MKDEPTLNAIYNDYGFGLGLKPAEADQLQGRFTKGYPMDDGSLLLYSPTSSGKSNGLPTLEVQIPKNQRPDGYLSLKIHIGVG